MNMQRIEPELTPEYCKDPEDEAFLSRFNSILAPFQEEDYYDLPEAYPTLHVIGAPRSGTTLLMQSIATHLRIGYINNLIAAFWRAPVYGARLSKKLLPPGATSSFESNFGRTINIREPHEWGYFWSEMLGYREMRQVDKGFEDGIGWARLRKVLINMTHAFALPVAFKPMLLTWHLLKMQEVMPRACFVRIRRDPVQNALSLLQYRRTALGAPDKWGSLIPREYDWLKNEPYWKQVAGQIYFLECSVSKQIALMESRNVLEINYEQFCQAPHITQKAILSLLEANGGSVDTLSIPSNSFEPRQRTAEADPDYERVYEAVHEFYGKDYP